VFINDGADVADELHELNGNSERSMMQDSSGMYACAAAKRADNGSGGRMPALGLQNINENDKDTSRYSALKTSSFSGGNTENLAASTRRAAPGAKPHMMSPTERNSLRNS